MLTERDCENSWLRSICVKTSVCTSAIIIYVDNNWKWPGNEANLHSVLVNAAGGKDRINPVAIWISEATH